MKNYFIFLLIPLLSINLPGCSIIRQKSKAPLEEGIYRMKVYNANKYVRMYATVTGDSVRVYRLVEKHHRSAADSVHSLVYDFPPTKKYEPQNPFVFSQQSMDIDVLTIPFKYRPRSQGMPNQLNAGFNGAVYGGFRSDNYVISYKKTPLGQSLKMTTHYAYGFGLFAGLGSTAMNQWVTGNQVTAEYDGVVLTKGAAAIMGIGKLTFGMAFGFDHLLDNNHGYWIYQAKPWLGITVGLNLN